MNKAITFLVLTDHRVHKAGNPIYSVLPALRDHPACAHIHIASRGNFKNEDFFYDCEDDALDILSVEEGFAFDESGQQFLTSQTAGRLGEYDCILMRLPRPVEPSFMTFLAEIGKETVFINHPTGIERTSNKAYLLNFPSLCPPMKLCREVNEILEFAAEFPIVLKPLKEYGGKGILKIEGNTLYEGNKAHPVEAFLLRQANYIKSDGYLAMKYMQHVDQGDKRILLVGGEIMGASLRLPSKGSWLCNVAQGGRSVPTEVTAAEHDIIRQITPALAKEGILIAGVDTLMGDHGRRILSEINTLSVGGFSNIQEQSGKPVIQQSIQAIIHYVNQKKGSE